MSDEKPKFKGFAPPEQNWSKLPHDFVESLADINSLAEVKVVLYTLRHTWGYQEFGIRKRISTEEFMNGRRREDGTRLDRGTGLSKQSVIDGVRRAIEDEFIIEEVDDSDQGRIKKYYMLKMREDTGDVQHLDADVKNLDRGGKVSRPRTTERNLNKDTSGKIPEETTTPPQDVVVDLIEFGITEVKAKELATKYPPEFLETKMQFLEWKLDNNSGRKITDTAAWLVAAIEHDYQAPPAFKTKEQIAEEERARREFAMELSRRSMEEFERKYASADQEG